MPRVYCKELLTKIRHTSDTAKTKTVIWGDWLDVEDHPARPTHWQVRWRVFDDVTDTVTIDRYEIPKAQCQDEALLEMVFLDVGQGDGCIVSVPDGNRQAVFVVDAGDGANMYNFLKWRFRFLDGSVKFHAAVITHPDRDHYQGFQQIFDDSRLAFETVYFNGLLERGRVAKDDLIGPVDFSGPLPKRCTQLFQTHAEVHDFYSVEENRTELKDGRLSLKLFPKLLWTALQAPNRFGSVKMMSTAQGEQAAGRAWLPGFAPDGAKPAIEVIGPVPLQAGDGSLALPAFGMEPGDAKYNVGKTKNGNSIVMRLHYGKLSVLFGGDLNRPAEDYLLRHYGGIDGTVPLAQAVQPARSRLSADILKCCHHGSGDVTDEFVRAVNPFATVVSSGDQESHIHPRPEVVGMLGKNSRGPRPLVLSTELLRSTPESLRLSKAQAQERKRLEAAIDAAGAAQERKAAWRKLDDFWDARFRRLVTVYGAITMRSDGERLLIAFRKEVAKGNPWQLYAFEHIDGDWQGREVGAPDED